MKKYYDTLIEGSGGWQPIYGEWQLCPKCNGVGQLSDPTWNHDFTQVTINRTCDVCSGAKIIQKPIINLPQISQEQK